MRIVYFDTETTGLSPGQICQLAIIVEEDGNITEGKNYFFTVDYIEEGAKKTHGFSEEDLYRYSGGKRFKDYADEIYRYFNGAELVAHNIKFDDKFIREEFIRLGKIIKPVKKICTMELFKPILKLPHNKYRYKNPRLSELVDYYNIDTYKVMKLANKLFGSGDISYHDARYDVTATFVAYTFYREELWNTDDWHRVFVKNY